VLVLLAGCGGRLSNGDIRSDLPWVRSIEFEGNVAFSDGRLASLMELTPPDLTHPFRRSYYFKDLLEKDLLEIADFYEDHGYLDFRVVDWHEAINEKRGTVGLVVRVEEGPVTRVRSVRFEGVRAIPEHELSQKIRLAPGAPLSPFVLDGDRQRILLEYQERGYLYAACAGWYQLDDHSADVVYELREGVPARLQWVRTRGNATTQRHFITRELTLRYGELMSRSQLLRSQERLGKLGLFSHVHFVQEVADSSKGLVDLTIEVRERKHGWYGFGLGFSSDERATLSGEWGQRNIMGTTRRVRIDGGIGWEVDSLFTEGANKDLGEASAHATWVEPWFLGTRTEASFGIYHEFERQPSAVQTRTNGIRSTFQRELGRWVNVFLTLENEWVGSTDSTLRSQDYVTLATRFRTERDTRNNILDPTRGSFQRWTLEYAGPPNGDFSFAKTLLSTSHARSKRPYRQRVLAFRIQGGYIHPLRSEGVGEGVASLVEIPYNDRFFIGGATTLRGYRKEQLGPLDEGGLSMGGRVHFLGNIEYRFPLIWKLAGGVFVDAGNIWADPRELKLSRLVGEFEGSYSRMDVRYTTGLGIRFQTPVGPFRVDYGHKLGAARREYARRWELHFSLGHAF